MNKLQLKDDDGDPFLVSLYEGELQIAPMLNAVCLKRSGAKKLGLILLRYAATGELTDTEEETI